MILDIESHIFPDKFVHELINSKEQLRVVGPDDLGRMGIIDSFTGLMLTYFRPGTPFTDLELRLNDMRRYAIDTQVLSINPPGIDRILNREESYRLCRVINDSLAEIVSSHPSSFMGLASIPFNDPELAVDEIKRSIKDLGLRGLVIPSNTLSKFYDSNEFDIIFSTAEALGVPLFMHPTQPVAWKDIGPDYNLSLIYGWPFDTTLSLARLAFSGALKRFPNLNIIAAHGGGMIPFFIKRAEMLINDTRGTGKLPNETAINIKNLYFDTAIFYTPSIELLLKFAGDDHIIFGTDYPFGSDNYQVGVNTIHELKNKLVEEKIFSKNLESLLKTS